MIQEPAPTKESTEQSKHKWGSKCHFDKEDYRTADKIQLTIPVYLRPGESATPEPGQQW
jgi:hypothetical protein